MERREVIEENTTRQLRGVVTVDCLDAEQGKIAFALFGWPNLSGHARAIPQAEATDLAWRDIDVVWAGEVVVVGAAEKAEAIGKDLQRAFAKHQPVELDPFFQNPKHQLVLLDASDVATAFLASELD